MCTYVKEEYNNWYNIPPSACDILLQHLHVLKSSVIYCGNSFCFIIIERVVNESREGDENGKLLLSDSSTLKL